MRLTTTEAAVPATISASTIEANRIFAGTTTSATHEFDSLDIEIPPHCYSIESVTKFQLESNKTDGGPEQWWE